MQQIFLGNDLAAVEKVIWQLLQEATRSYKAVFHYGTVANVQNSAPALRTVILRHADALEKKLFFHTDIRSPKVEALQKDNRVSWSFYSEPIKLQVRMTAEARIHYENEVAENAWQKLKPNSHITYSALHAPGLPLTEHTNVAALEGDFNLLQFAKSNFAVVETSIQTIDFLFLHHAGNRRAFFNCASGERYWVQA